MIYLALVDSNRTVISTLEVDAETVSDAKAYLLNNYGFAEDKLIEVTYEQATSYESPLIRYTYDPARDAFIPPRPFLSWTFNLETLDWDPPVPYPEDGKLHEWDESIRNWVEVTE